MLTLSKSYRIHDCTVYGDDVDPARFYVLPESPNIARDAAGKPIFSLVVYRQDETRLDPTRPRDDVGGGIMTFTVELTVPDEKLKRIRGSLAQQQFGDDSDREGEIRVEIVTSLEGKVSVSIAGEGTGDTGDAHTFVRSAVGAGKVAGVGGNRKAVMVNLTQSGAALLSQVERLRTLPINVQYDLSFEHRLLGVTMTVLCDLSSTVSLVQEFVPREVKEVSDEGGYADGTDYEWKTKDVISKVTESLSSTRAIKVSVVPESSAVDAETLASLEKFGFELVNREIEKLIPPTAVKDMGVDRQWLHEFTSKVSSSLNFSLDRKMVLLRNFYPSANISNLFEGADAKEMVTYVDLRVGFFSFLKVPVRVNADFASTPLDSVVVTVKYDRARIDGSGREQRRESFSFTDGATIQTFQAYANTLEELTYDWSAIVHYKGSQEQYELNRTEVRDNFLVVDVGLLGMLRVDVGLGLVDVERFPTAAVTLRYHSRALGRTLEQTVALTKEKPNTVWIEVVREDPSAGYEYKVDWLRKDGEILPGEFEKSTSSRLRLEAPVPSQLTVTVVPTGDFKNEISQVIASLIYRDPANNYVQEKALAFTADNQAQPWTVDLRDASRREYQYRYSIIYKDGVVRSVPADDDRWLDGVPGFVVVGEKFGLEVEVVSALLTYPDQAKVVQVDLSYDDPEHDISDRQSFTFFKETTAKTVTWRVRTDPRGPKHYTVDVSYFSAAGGVTRLPQRTSETEVLMIEPLATPPPTPGPTPSPTDIPR